MGQSRRMPEPAWDGCQPLPFHQEQPLPASVSPSIRSAGWLYHPQLYYTSRSYFYFFNVLILPPIFWSVQPELDSLLTVKTFRNVTCVHKGLVIYKTGKKVPGNRSYSLWIFLHSYWSPPEPLYTSISLKTCLQWFRKKNLSLKLPRSRFYKPVAKSK